MKKLVSIFILISFTISLAHAVEPERNKGISVHALPKRVAKLSGAPWGFQVSYAPYLKPEPGQPFLQSLEDVLAYVKKQDKIVIENGLWVVTTHPASYSKEEIEFQNKVKKELPNHKIPFFWARGSELPNGFKRY